MYCGGNGALKNIYSDVSSAKTKHTGIRLHGSRELQAQGIVKCDCVSTDNNLADTVLSRISVTLGHPTNVGVTVILN